MAGARDSKPLAFALWCWNKIVDNWLGIMLIGGGSSAMSYVAAITDFLEPYAPFSWGAVGVLTAVLICSAMALYGLFRSRLALAQFQEHRSDAVDINPLADSFTRKRIRLFDFFHPFFKPTHAARFQDCELFGPAIVHMQQCTLLHGNFHACDFAIVRSGAMTTTSMLFSNCIFERCNFYRVLFLVTEEHYKYIVGAVGGEINLISQRPPT